MTDERLTLLGIVCLSTVLTIYLINVLLLIFR